MGNCLAVQQLSPSGEQQPGCCEDDVQSASTLQQPSPSAEQQTGRCEDDVQSASTLQQPSPSAEQQLRIEECIKLFNEGKDKWNIDVLISVINDLLEATLHPEKPSTSATSSRPKTSMPIFLSLIRCGGKFLKFVNEYIVKEDIEKTSSKDNVLGAEGTKILSDILQQLGNAHWIVGGLSIVGYLLSKFVNMSGNEAECLELLKCMVYLVNHIKKLNIYVPEEEERLKDAFLLIVEGCIMCSSQIQSGKFFRFLKTSVNSEMLKGLSSKISNLYRDLSSIAVTGIQQQLSVTLPLTQPTYPSGTVGLEEPLNEIIDMLEIGKPKDGVKAIVIYGFGGIGKTTLASAVFANLKPKLEGFNYTKIIFDEDPHKNDFTRMQEQLLHDAFPEYQQGRNIILRHCEEGRDQLTQAFERETNKPVFTLIDNVLRVEDMKKLLPEDLGGLPQGSRILVTARDLSVIDFFKKRGLSCRHYRVKTLADEHAEKILCTDPVKVEQIKGDVKKILQICGGIPLCLKIVGAQLKKGKYKANNCSEILQILGQRKEIKQEHLSERLFYSVYNRLETSAQEAFLDICTFYSVKHFTRRYIEYVVGVTEVATLEESALITAVPFVNSFDNIRVYWQGEEKLIVPDNVILVKGRSIAKDTRIVDDAQSLYRAVEDQNVLQNIKGVEIPYNDESEYILEESQLSCMSNSLRAAFILGPRISIRGRSSNPFQELRYLQLDGDIPCLPVNLEALPRLAMYVGPFFKEGFSIYKLPKSLRFLRARAQSNRDECATSESNPFQTVQNSWLQELNLSALKNMRVLLEGIHQFTELKILWVDYWDEMEELPAEVCQQRSLNKLIMSGWKSLKRLPESISNLTGLTHLDLGFCPRLEGLCSSFGELRGLRYLDLRYCTMLTELPQSFGQLTALECLYLQGCERLTILPDNFGQLTALKYLNLSYCYKLTGLPLNFVELTNLQVFGYRGEEPLSSEDLRSFEIRLGHS